MFESSTSILVVDDNPHYLSVLSKMLESGFGFEDVCGANSIQEARETISQNPEKFRILLVDYQFPGDETGADFLEQLAREGYLEGKCAFLVTSEPSVESVKRVSMIGGIAVLAKPVDRAELEKQLKRAHQVLSQDSVESF